MLHDEKTHQGWLIVIYRVPSTPSTSRVTIWKRIKELGAYLLQQSVYLLPNLPQTREAVNALKDQIQHLGGECKVLEIPSLGEEQEREVVTGFNSNREEEYTEVVKACNELLREIEDESKTEDFHFADMEENEKHLQRVRDLLENVIKRDYFRSKSRTKASQMLRDCEEKFGAFSQEVYAREGIVSDDKKTQITLDVGTKNKQKKVLSRQELVLKLSEIIGNLDRGSLEVGSKKVASLMDQSVLEWDYKENKEGNILELKISWLNFPGDKKDNR